MLGGALFALDESQFGNSNNNIWQINLERYEDSRQGLWTGEPSATVIPSR